jgi:hypothetical protein
MDFDWKEVKYTNGQFENKPPIGRPLLLREDSYYTWIDELCELEDGTIFLPSRMVLVYVEGVGVVDDLISAYAELNTPEEKYEAAVNNAKNFRTDSLQTSLRMHTLTKHANTNRPLKIKGLKGIADMLGK